MMFKKKLFIFMTSISSQHAMSNSPDDKTLSGPHIHTAYSIELQRAPEVVNIESIYSNGSKCGNESVTGELSEDRQSISFYYDDLMGVKAGKGVSRRESISSCNLSFVLNVPKGWQYALNTVTYSGAAKVTDDNTRSLMRSTVYMAGPFNDVRFQALLSGAVEGFFAVDDKISMDSVLWSRCGKAHFMNVATNLRLHARRSIQQQNFVFLFGENASQTFGIVWRRCL